MHSEESSSASSVMGARKELSTTPAYSEDETDPSPVTATGMLGTVETAEQMAFRMTDSMMTLLENCLDHMRKMAEQLRRNTLKIKELKFHKKVNKQLKLQETFHEAEIKDLKLRVKELENCLERPPSEIRELRPEVKENELCSERPPLQIKDLNPKVKENGNCLKDPLSEIEDVGSKVKGADNCWERLPSEIKDLCSNVKETENCLDRPPSDIKDHRPKMKEIENCLASPSSDIKDLRSKVKEVENCLERPPSEKKDLSSNVKEAENCWERPSSDFNDLRPKTKGVENCLGSQSSDIKDLRSLLKGDENCLERPPSDQGAGDKSPMKADDFNGEVAFPRPPSGKVRFGSRRPYAGTMHTTPENMGAISGTSSNEKYLCSTSRLPPLKTSRLPVSVVCPFPSSSHQNPQYRSRRPQNVSKYMTASDHAKIGPRLLYKSTSPGNG